MSTPLLQAQLLRFIENWAPTCWMKRRDFCNQLQVVLESYGKAALAGEVDPERKGDAA